MSAKGRSRSRITDEMLSETYILPLSPNTGSKTGKAARTTMSPRLFLTRKNTTRLYDHACLHAYGCKLNVEMRERIHAWVNVFHHCVCKKKYTQVCECRHAGMCGVSVFACVHRKFTHATQHTIQVQEASCKRVRAPSTRKDELRYSHASTTKRYSKSPFQLNCRPGLDFFVSSSDTAPPPRDPQTRSRCTQ